MHSLSAVIIPLLTVFHLQLFSAHAQDQSSTNRTSTFPSPTNGTGPADLSKDSLTNVTNPKMRPLQIFRDQYFFNIFSIRAEIVYGIYCALGLLGIILVPVSAVAASRGKIVPFPEVSYLNSTPKSPTDIVDIEDDIESKYVASKQSELGNDVDHSESVIDMPSEEDDILPEAANADEKADKEEEEAEETEEEKRDSKDDSGIDMDKMESISGHTQLDQRDDYQYQWMVDIHKPVKGKKRWRDFFKYDLLHSFYRPASYRLPKGWSTQGEERKDDGYSLVEEMVSWEHQQYLEEKGKTENSPPHDEGVTSLADIIKILAEMEEQNSDDSNEDDELESTEASNQEHHEDPEEDTSTQLEESEDGIQSSSS